MYAGLKISDKPALLDAKAKGANWIARDANGFLYGYTGRPKKRDNIDEWDYYQLGERIKNPSQLLFIQWFDLDPVNIDLALAQIAEMEKALPPAGCAYCTSDILQGYALEIIHGKYPKIVGLSSKGIVSKGQSAFAYCPNCGRSLDSPAEVEQ